MAIGGYGARHRGGPVPSAGGLDRLRLPQGAERLLPRAGRPGHVVRARRPSAGQGRRGRAQLGLY